jgi:phenylalanyl-tRNA synthetase alpha chain
VQLSKGIDILNAAMNYMNTKIAETASLLISRVSEMVNKTDILKAIELKALFEELKQLPPEERADFGRELNQLKTELTKIADGKPEQTPVVNLDISAPFDENVSSQNQPAFLPAEFGTKHPLMTELSLVLDIFNRMGFTSVESREIDDDYHMFTSLNFPEGHPARDDYDTFMTIDTDKTGKPLIAPAHTSTMQNRVLKKFQPNLSNNRPIAVVIPGRVFRNEDLDSRHEHTFYQFEGVYVNKSVNVGNLISTLKIFFQEYYQRNLKVKIQPFYFPFTEPSFEFAAECIFCNQKGCAICSYSGWLELMGCGMIHPNVLRNAAIDPEIYTGFAWGGGIERPVMIKYAIEDIRYFESAKLDFLRQFK